MELKLSCSTFHYYNNLTYLTQFHLFAQHFLFYYYSLFIQRFTLSSTCTQLYAIKIFFQLYPVLC